MRFEICVREEVLREGGALPRVTMNGGSCELDGARFCEGDLVSCGLVGRYRRVVDCLQIIKQTFFDLLTLIWRFLETFDYELTGSFAT